MERRRSGMLVRTRARHNRFVHGLRSMSATGNSRTAESVGVNSPRNARETVGISGRGIIEQSSHVTGRAVI
jgi:hypothetical protein